jgi:CDP-diacylglycerol--glycerol-3-phosphate 3-phosphatidyltransferase
MSRLNWPNRITIARIVLVVPFVICLLNLNADGALWRYVSLVLFVTMSLSDALDGFLARRFRESTALGRFLDPVGDKLLVTSAMILLSVDATAVHGFRLPSWVPVIAISKDVLTVIGFLLLYAVTGRFFIRPRVLGKVCTLVQLVMVGLMLSAPDWAGLAAKIVPVFWWLTSGLAIAALADYLRIGSRFAAENAGEA